MAVTVLVVIIGFTIFGPPGKMAIGFRKDPLDNTREILEKVILWTIPEKYSEQIRCLGFGSKDRCGGVLMASV